MKNFQNSLLLIILLALISSGCLTYEKKEFKLTGKNSGVLTMKYINIMSIMDNDTLDVSEDDFDVLVSEYLNGEEIENKFPGAKNIQKRLFEENGVLCGEVSMDFDNLEDVKLYRFKDIGPLMINVINFEDTETYKSSNGDYGGDIMPVVFWDGNFTELELTTQYTTPDKTCVSLLSRYKSWQETAVD